MAELHTFQAQSSQNAFDRWHALTCRSYSRTECKKPAGGGFGGRISMKPFGALSVSEITSTLPDDHVVVSRSAYDVRVDPRNDFMLYLGMRGELGLRQADRTAVLKAGDMALYDQAQPFDLDFIGNVHATVITIPRPLLSSRLPGADQSTAILISAGTNIGILVGGIVAQLNALQEEQINGVTPRLLSCTIDLLAAGLEVYFDRTATPANGGARLKKVKHYILDNLQRHDLTLETIAKEIGVAPRTLNRLFVAEGTTPIKWLWKQRLAASYKALVEKRISHVSDAAFQFGFSELSHFSRSFKQEFGVTPQSLLR